MATRCTSIVEGSSRRCGLSEGHIGTCTPPRRIARLVPAYACPTHHSLPFSYAPGNCELCPRDLVMVGA